MDWSNLKSDYQRLGSQSLVAKEYGCAQQTVAKAMKRLGIAAKPPSEQRRKPSADPLKLEEALVFVQAGRTIQESAEMVGLTIHQVSYAMIKADTPVPLRWVDKPCLSCDEMFRPTNGRQITCERPECKEWRKANPDIKPKLLRDHGAHGTEARYIGGCRCDLCCLAHNHRKGFYRHGMTIAEYNMLLDIQGGGCALCHCTTNNDKRAKSFDVDHSHACVHKNERQSCSKCWRGLLCRRCNSQLERMVGHAYVRELEGCATEDDESILNYIRTPPANVLRSRCQSRTDT